MKKSLIEIVEKAKKANLKYLVNLKRLLDSFPENNNVKSISPNIQIIGFNNLTNSILSPEYYNFKKQYQKVYSILENTPTEQVVEKLKKIIKEKQLDRFMKLHPEVLKNLKLLIDEKTN